MAIPILTADEMREVDRMTIEEIGIPGSVLMEQAGRACAEELERFVPPAGSGRVAVVCGKGNNGGDGLVAARYLLCAGHRVDVFLLADPAGLRGDALLYRRVLDRLGHPIEACASEAAARSLDLRGYDGILDAIFGTGLSSEVRGVHAAAICAINASGAPVVSVDLPSGLSADSGAVLGSAVEARSTVTFGAPKRGHLLYPGSKRVGDLTVVDIGFPPQLYPSGPGSTWLVTDDDLTPYLAEREPDAHKGDFGHLLVVAGSADKPGAAGLCCAAACRSGAGLVTLASAPDVVERVVAGAVEYMGEPIRDATGLLDACRGKQAVCLGPGLGQRSEAVELVRRAVDEVELPMVVDADGLNHLVSHLELLRRAPAERVLTPHPGEMARLLGATTGEIQRDRFGVSRRLAADTGCVVVLKGAGTVVCDPDGTAFLIPTGNPGMAAGGAGDVLTGVIGSLLCQGLSALEAACVGAYLHGAAGDLAAREKGQRGQVARDLVEQLPAVLRRAEGFRSADDDDFG